MSYLLDGNVLVALMLQGHVHHDRANAWFASNTLAFHTCAVTEGTFLRLHIRLAVDSSAKAAWSTLAQFQSHPRHEFIDDGFSYAAVPYGRLLGFKQVTDTWLAQLSRSRAIKLATLDAGLVSSHPDVAFLVP